MSNVAVRDEPANGPVWGCLAQAVRILRWTPSFEAGMQQACDVDTVACVTGGLAAASFGLTAIPWRWTTRVHGVVDGRLYQHHDLQTLALRLTAGR